MGFSVKVMKLRDDAIIPTRAHKSDAGLDLYSVETMMIQPGKDVLVPTGIVIDFPHGWVAVVKEKSGRAVKNKLTIGACVIDSGYRGELLAHLFNHSDKTLLINKGEKIAQLILVPCWTGTVEIVSNMDSSERGENGFGSTGLFVK